MRTPKDLLIQKKHTYAFQCTIYSYKSQINLEVSSMDHQHIHSTMNGPRDAHHGGFCLSMTRLMNDSLRRIKATTEREETKCKVSEAACGRAVPRGMPSCDCISEINKRPSGVGVRSEL